MHWVGILYIYADFVGYMENVFLLYLNWVLSYDKKHKKYIIFEKWMMNYT